MPAEPGDQAVALAAQFSLAVTRLARELAARNPPGLTVVEAAVLRDLGSGPATPAELAAAERIRPPSMTRHITRLEARGLIARDPHPADRRQVVLTRTEAGRKVLADADSRSWLAGELRKLPAGSRDVLRAALGVMLKLDTVCRANDL